MPPVHEIVDLDRYPIHETGRNYDALVADGHTQLANCGLFTMPGFVRPSCITRMQREAQNLLAHAHRQDRFRDGIYPAGHPTPKPTRVSLSCVGLDQMRSDSPMHQLYLWDRLTEFIGDVLRRKPYYRSEDPIIGSTLTCMNKGDEQGWHFDPNDGVVSLAVQKAGRGGEFEFARFDADDDPTEALIDSVVDNRFDGLIATRADPGTLTIFNGMRALHRVAPVQSDPARLMLLFSYEDRPHQQFSNDLRQQFFGRTEPLHRQFTQP